MLESSPQFTTAEYSGAGNNCTLCRQPITARYFLVNQKTVCEGCTRQVKQRFFNDSRSIYLRSLLLGIGAAVIGMIGYAAFAITTGFSIGYLSFAVGWLIAKAMMVGSKGIGGRRYQITAVLLTYAAVSIAFVPILISYQMKYRADVSQGRVYRVSPGEDSSQIGTRLMPGRGPFLVGALLVGLASPVLKLRIAPLSGLLSLLILAVGIRIAWQMTAGLPRTVIQGPFDRPRSATV